MKSKYYEWTKQLIQEGYNYAEIAKIQGRDMHNVRKTCIKTGLTQNLTGKTKIEKNAIEKMAHQIDKHGYELIDCIGGVDGIIHIKCKVCGNILERKAQAARKPYAIICDNCRDNYRAEKAEKIIRQKEADKKQRYLEKRYKRIKVVSHQTELSTCKCCGEIFVSYSGRKKYCSDTCMKRVNNAWHKDRRIRKIKSLLIDTNITLQRLYERDGGTCAICGCICDWNDCEVRDDGAFIAFSKYPSIDHIRPISKGGLHAWENVQLACRECNIKKSAG